MVELRVSFYAPADTTIQLQGNALDAYYEWLEDPSEENERYLSDQIYDQCEMHIAMWSELNEWEVVD